MHRTAQDVAKLLYAAKRKLTKLLAGGPDAHGLTDDEILVFNVYTQESPFYQVRLPCA